MRAVKQLAGMVQHYAAVQRVPGKSWVYIYPQTIRQRRYAAVAAWQELGFADTWTRIERVYLSYEVDVEVPETVAEIRAERSAAEARVAARRRR